MADEEFEYEYGFEEAEDKKEPKDEPKESDDLETYEDEENDGF